MAMVINTNTASLTTQRHLSSSRGEMEVAMERMSSGSRINSSMDDAAGLAIGNRMTSQIEGLNQAVRNANDGISLAQTAEGALGSSQGILQRMRVLAVQAANDTYSSMDRKAINNEIVQLKEELNRGVNQASFNGNKILNGTNASFTFQVGHMSGDNVVVTLGDMRGSMIGTQSWDPKASTTAPPTVQAVASEAAGTAGTVVATMANTTDGDTGGSVQAVATMTFTAGAVLGDAVTVGIGASAEVSGNFTFTTTTTTAADAATAYVAGASVTGFTLAAVGDTVTFTQDTAADLTMAATVTASQQTATDGVAGQESYDYSGITLATGDRVSLTIGTKTYTQEFTTNQASTLSALGALVVNGEASYISKTVNDAGKLVFTAAVGTPLAAATAAVETSSVSEANSVDDILVTDATSAKAALAVVDGALDMMSDFRAVLGASSNRMFITVDNLMSMSENTSAARSRIVDADFAAESAALAKSQVLQKAGTAMLSQANASTQDILSLLK